MIQKNRGIALLTALLILGEILGIVLLRIADSQTRITITTILENSFIRQIDGDVGTVFYSSMFTAVLLLLLCFLLGLSLWGMFLIPIIPLFQGICLGISALSLFYEKGLHGLAFFLLSILPGAFFLAAAVVVAARESLKASHSLFLRGFQKESVAFSVRTYFIRFGLLSFLAIFSAVLDSLTSLWFAPLLL